MRRAFLWRASGELSQLLRDAVQRVPPSGTPLATLESQLRDSLGSDGDVGNSLLPSSWADALVELRDQHYITDNTLYACNWEKTLQTVAEAIPHEGVTESGLIDCIRHVVPHFSSQSTSLGSEPFSHWVQRLFPHIFCVSRSATNGVPVYRRVPEPLSPEAASITHALRLLGRAGLPVHTDFGLIAPLLPTSLCPARGSWISFLEKEAVRHHFDVEVEASVRLAPGNVPCKVFVDATSLDVRRIDDIIADRGLVSSLCVIKVFRRASDPMWSSDDVVLQDFLDPEHAIGASIASMRGESAVNVHVLCGSAVKSRYEAALVDLLRDDGTTVSIFSPNGVESEKSK